MSDFPLCKAAGLKPVYVIDDSMLGWRVSPIEWLPAKDVETLLASAPVVYGKSDKEANFSTTKWFWTYKPIEEDTHSGRLIMIEPIKKETPRPMNLDEADAMAVKIFGLNTGQIDELRLYYEQQTGFRADNIGISQKKSREERATELLRVMVDRQFAGDGDWRRDKDLYDQAKQFLTESFQNEIEIK